MRRTPTQRPRRGSEHPAHVPGAARRHVVVGVAAQVARHTPAVPAEVAYAARGWREAECLVMGAAHDTPRSRAPDATGGDAAQVAALVARPLVGVHDRPAVMNARRGRRGRAAREYTGPGERG